jgi:hypothetical protein
MEKTANLWSEFVFFKKIVFFKFLLLFCPKGRAMAVRPASPQLLWCDLFLGNTSPAVSAGEVNKPR